MLPVARSGRASSGRALKPPENRVVSMPTLWLSRMSQTRSMSAALAMAYSCVQNEERRPARAGSEMALLAIRLHIPICCAPIAPGAIFGVGFDDLHLRLLRSAAGAAAQRPAVRGDLQRSADRAVP